MSSNNIACIDHSLLLGGTGFMQYCQFRQIFYFDISPKIVDLIKKTDEFINLEVNMIDKQVLQCQHCLSSLGCVLGHGCRLALLSANKNTVRIS